MIFVVDNYDSFTYNLVQALGKLDPDVEVARNDRFDPDAVVTRRPAAVVVSPGPGRPEDAGRSMAMISAAERERIPLLGVCLGHQALGALHGARVERATPRHGKSSAVAHDGRGIFAGLPSPFRPRDTIRSSCARRDCRTICGSPPGATTASSWGSRTATCRSSAFSSIPSPS